MERLITRRNFIKTAGAGILSLQAVDALAWPSISPPLLGNAGQIGGGTNTSWATWDETTETGWGDSSNTFIMVPAGGASADEAGQGAGLAGANLILSQNGAIAATTGTPSYRQLDGSNDYFTATVTMLTTFLKSRNVWTLVWGLNTCTASAGGRQDICYIHDSAANRFYLSLTGGSGNKLYAELGRASWTPQTTDAVPETGMAYICIWSDGTYIRMGFTVSKPSRWSDFASTKRQSTTSALTAMEADADTQNIISSIFAPIKTRLYFFVASKLCLIDNDS